MRIFVDECVDERLVSDIIGHEVKSARQMGWLGIKNGALLALASEQFDVFLTVDRNLSFQQNLTGRLAVIVLRAKSNRLADLRPLVPRLLDVLSSAKRGTATLVAL